MEGGLEQYLLTSEHITTQFDKMEALYKAIYKDSRDSSHPMDLYRYIDLEMNPEYEIFALSDLHADVRRFLQVLVQAGFISPDIDMQDPISNLRWNPEKTNKIIVICGDLIDGRRGGDNKDLSYCDELIIHMVIYNLRILARRYNSYVFCTLGNHDFFAFHASTLLKSETAYAAYIDSESLAFYDDEFTRFTETYLSDTDVKDYTVSSAEYIDLIYFSRTHLLSRFYLIGYQPFLRINKILFAHAGFHLKTDVFSLFEENGMNSSSVQPHSLHRMFLEYVSRPRSIMSYLTKMYFNKYIVSYSEFYKQFIIITLRMLEDKKLPMTSKLSISELEEPYMSLAGNQKLSMFYDLFLTRVLQKNCGQVEEILLKYGCNSLIVGHCPTCFGGEGIFDPRNVAGITSCDNARIVYSCDSKLVTVDIAMSSAFSPHRKFLELLHIHNINDEQHIETVRYELYEDRVTIYNKKRYDGAKWIQL
jgi:hypothetical protein